VDHVVTRKDPTELRVRAARLRVVLTDVDGVLTDGGVYYGEHGEVLKRFNVRDGMGVERLRNAGVQTAFVTREESPSVRARAQKLALPHLFLGVRDKAAALPGILDALHVSAGEVAYIGDDVNDASVLEIVRREGLTGAPADAVPEVRTGVDFVAAANGGHGAFREFAEWLLSLRKTGE
jgi:3-deoxy-D-manno-octulosonate 8-phosphate phosphatase (KDO 8-P phosphatase)